MKQPRFSIHDAFEEENDEAIRVYGSTVVSNVPRPSSSGTTASAPPATNSGTNYVSNTPTNEMSCDPRLDSKRFVRFSLRIDEFSINNSLDFDFPITEIINLELMIRHPEIVIH